jgi:hypothetical protein
MIDRKITLPDMILFAGTRVALGVGIGMLVSKSLTREKLRVGAHCGAFTTIPLIMALIDSKAGSRIELAA